MQVLQNGPQDTETRDALFAKSPAQQCTQTLVLSHQYLQIMVIYVPCVVLGAVRGAGLTSEQRDTRRTESQAALLSTIQGDKQHH